MKQARTPFPELQRRAESFLVNLPMQVSHIANEHFVSNFTRQGYFDEAGTLVPWKATKAPSLGGRRSILIQSGRLRRDISPSPGRSFARVVADSPYAKLHNRGGEVRVTPGMRRYFWAMYYKHGGGKQRGRRNAMAQYYKNLALTKKSSFTVPARPFLQSNPVLNKEISAFTFTKLRSIFQSVR